MKYTLFYLKSAIKIGVGKRNKTKKELAMKYEIDYEIAYRAHAGTSFSPEKRAQSAQKDFADHIQEIEVYFNSLAETKEQKATAEALGDLYAKKYHKLYTEYLQSRHGLMSTMITGPANFPVARMEKKNRSIDNKLNTLIDFTKSKRVQYAKAIRETKPEGYNELDDLRGKLADMEKFHDGMKQANSILKKMYKKGGVTIGEFNAVFEETTGLTIAFMEKMHWRNSKPCKGYESFELTNHNSKIKTVRAQIEKLNKQESATSEDNNETTFEGGTIIQNKVDDRLQILFDSIPAPAIREELKRNGFRWSPKNQAWLTGNAVFSLKRLSFIGGNYKACKLNTWDEMSF